MCILLDKVGYEISSDDNGEAIRDKDAIGAIKWLKQINFLHNCRPKTDLQKSQR